MRIQTLWSALLITLFFGLTACNKPSKTDSNEAKTASAEKAPKPKLKNPTITPIPAAKAIVEKPAPKPAPKPVVPTAIPKAKPPVAAQGPSPALFNPALAKLQAPTAFTVRLETTRGDIYMNVNRAWAPLGADRFFNLVKAGYYTDVAFFRVIKGFMAQVGMNGNPKVNAAWQSAGIKDDPVRKSNTRGTVSFASRGPNTRTTQFFINFGNNARLDKMKFSPFATIDARSMPVVDALYNGYGEGAPRGKGPSQGQITRQGNRYLRASFPKLDYIKRASVVSVKTAAPARAATQRPQPMAATQRTARPGPASATRAIAGPAKATERAPAKFSVTLETTKGNIVVDMERAWAPIGVDRFYNLVRMGYYTDVAFFRVVKGFMAQVGISGNPQVNVAWQNSNLKDDPVKQSNKRGWVTFATRGPNTRTTQFFINFTDRNSFLDRQGFTPIGKVTAASMPVVDALYGGYGEGAPRGKGPSQSLLKKQGNTYLRKAFPRLDYIKRARITAAAQAH
mgnify:CR=1 FL=1